MSIMNVKTLSRKTKCKDFIVRGFLTCCLLVSKHNEDAIFANKYDLLDFLTRDFFTDEDFYIILRVNAYWGDKMSNMTAAENALFMHMLEMGRQKNIGVASIFYKYMKEHFSYGESGSLETLESLVFEFMS